MLRGASVWRPGHPPARSVTVRGGVIVAVGEPAPSGAEIVDVPAGFVVPGFVDAHVHPPTAGRLLLTVNLDGLTSAAQCLDAVAAYAAAHPDQEWITGGGWAMELFPGGLPRREDLDAAAPGRAVFLMNRDVHGAWASSRALERAGITRDTPDPPDGRIERDDDGTPTGALHEGAAYRVSDDVIPPPSATDWEAATLAAQAHLHALGVTSWQDAWVTRATQAAYASLAGDGRLRSRVTGALWWDRHRGLEQVAELVERRRAVGSFHPTTVKIMLDGVVENGTAAMLDPYVGSGNRGLTYVDELAAAVTALDAAGFPVHLHTIGDRAVRNALDAIAHARTVNGASGHRHQLAHIQVIDPADVPRFAELGVVANAQAYWAQHEPQMDELTLPVLGPERGRLQYPFASLLASGARLAMGSDWSVTTADPLAQLEVAVTRVDPEHRDTPPFLPDERLTLTQALTAFTSGSAHATHDDDAGAIEVGRRADLVVLDADLFAPGASLPSDARVELTMVAGEVVHRSAGAPGRTRPTLPR